MSSILRIALLLVLTFGYSSAAFAQQRPLPDRRNEVRERVRQELRADETQQQRAADVWATARRLPRSVRQDFGGRVALVGYEAGRPRYLASTNRAAAQTTGTLRLHPGQALGLQLTGSGHEIGIWDGGVPLATHQELAGRIAIRDADADAEDHATHVAGTLAAAGVRADARGMAFRARLRAYDWFQDAAEMTEEAPRGLTVSNHSYGLIAGWFYGDLEDAGTSQWYWLGDPAISPDEDPTFGAYDFEAAQFDRVVFAHPELLPVVAAGNDRADRGPRSGTYRALDASGEWQSYDVGAVPRARDGGADGFDTMAGASLAKNVLTVGSIGLGERVSYFSSFGPADDGRIKPDLVGYGENVLSSVTGSATSYGTSSGTSMATPNVAGSLVLLQEYHEMLAGRPLRAASLKGLALHTARDLGTPGPDYRTGWGLLDASAAADHLSRTREEPLALIEDELGPGATFTRTMTVEDGAALRLTLAWTDFAGAGSRRAARLDDPAPALRNDLDLRLVAEADGAVYEPFVLDVQAPAEAARRGDNRVDPVEQIRLDGVPAGTYRLVVTHKGRLAENAAQPFTVLVSGAESPSLPVSVAPGEAVGDVERVTLAWTTAFERTPGHFTLFRTPLDVRADGEQPAGPATEIGNVASLGVAETAQTYRFDDPLVPAGRHRYRMYFEGETGTHLAAAWTVDVPAPDGIAVLANYPNPFADRTRLVVDLPRRQHVTFDVFDLLGRRVARLHEGELAAGRHELTLDASTWAPGLYLARLATPEGTRTHRMTVLR